MTTSAITITAEVFAGFGLALLFGIFNAIGPIRTETGIRRLGWAFMAAALVTGLLLSTPAGKDAHAPIAANDGAQANPEAR